MKKFYLLFSLCLLSLASLAQNSSLVIKAPANEMRYLVANENSLPFYGLAKIVKSDNNVFTINCLANKPTILTLYVNEQTVKAYLSPGSCDTLVVDERDLIFYGDNKIYNDVLAELNKSDEYCGAYAYSNNHELRKLNNLTDYKNIIQSKKEADNALLQKQGLSASFVEQQEALSNWRYRALFFEKVGQLFNSQDWSDNWANELQQQIELPIENQYFLNLYNYRGVMENIVFIKNFIIEKKDPEQFRNQVNTFLFDEYCKLLEGKCLEYILACQIYNDNFQKDYSEDIPELYNRFVALFPNSQYKELLKEGVDETARFHAKNEDDTDIIILPGRDSVNTFEEAIKPFKGKLVYIDIWATWCGPCLRSFEHNDAMKKAVKEQGIDVVYLYLSVDRDYYAERWEKTIAFRKLKGYHLRTNEKLMDDVHTRFGDANGGLFIPRYLIINKAGEIAVAEAASPENPSAVVEQLKSAL